MGASPPFHLVALVALAACAPIHSLAAGNVTSWTCDPLANATVTPGATWAQLSCYSPSIPDWGQAGPVIVNILTADISSPALQLAPATAAASAGSLQTLDAIAASDGRNIIAGINGGYFYRLDTPTFFDGVCIGKSAADARENVSAAQPNYGVGDGSIVSRGTLLGSNCDCLGFNLPVFLTINGTASRIDMLGRAAAPPAGLALDSLAAGPNLVASNASGPFIAVPSNDENFLNILEHSANTALGLSADGRTAFFVTTDGYDACPSTNSSCGTNAYTLAYFMKDYLHVGSAMGMDQGGSTTMFVKGQPRNGIVTNPGQGVRNIFSGLFLVAA